MGKTPVRGWDSAPGEVSDAELCRPILRIEVIEFAPLPELFP